MLHFGWTVLPSGCWQWDGYYKSKGGYGNFKYQGKHYMAHRAAYEVWVGPIPEGHWVLHKCDYPPCMNPADLFTGTRQDNIDDMVAKGRHVPAIGTRSGNAVLTSEEVTKLRETRAETGLSYPKLASLFGISTSQAYRIVRHESRKDG